MGNNKTLGGGGFHHVAIKVKDFDATVAMYKQVLGCGETAAWGEGTGRGIMLDTGDGACFEVFASGSGEAPANGFYHIALRTTKLDEVVEKARAYGLTITTEPRDIVIASNPPLPARIAFFDGLDGESIELFQTA
jgi:catechol 2,3-dioxygenase-like lactoylglutathione lyase family enzyme